MATFRDNIQDAIQEAQAAVVKAEEIRAIIEQLPAEFLDYDWPTPLLRIYKFGLKDVELDMSLCGGHKDKAVTEIKDALAKTLGFAFEKVQHMYGQEFKYIGALESPIGGVKVTLELNSAPKPEGCTLIEKKEIKEVITYEAICEQTGEKV